MSDHHDEHEHHTIMGFLEEYWVLLFFGSFFMMTMFLPVLFGNVGSLFYWGVVVTLFIAMMLFLGAGLAGRMHNNRNKP